MPPTRQTKSDIVDSVKEVLIDFFRDFTCSCACDSNVRSSEDITVFKTLFDNQAALLSQLQSEIVVLKSEISMLRNQFEFTHSRQNASPRRLSSSWQKPNTDKTRNTQSSSKQTSSNNNNRTSLASSSNITVRRGTSYTSREQTNVNADEDCSSSDQEEDDETKKRPSASGSRKPAPNEPSKRDPPNKRINKRNKVAIVGTGNPDTRLSSAPSKLSIHVSKVSLNSTKEDVCNYVNSKLPNGQTATCEELTVRSGTYKGFKLTIDSDVGPSLLLPDFWPPGISVRRFYSPKVARENFRRRSVQETST